MHVIAYRNEGPDEGLVYMTRELDDDEPMVAREFANQVAASLGTCIAGRDGHIPNCCGDLRVEFVDHEPRVEGDRYQGSVRIWSGESFYFESGI